MTSQPLPDRSEIAVGDRVRIRSHLFGVVSGIDGDGVWVCMSIGLSYQIRGPFTFDDLERADA